MRGWASERDSDCMKLLKSFLPPSLSTAILMGIFLIPHGIGYRFSIGHIDIPRLGALILMTYWFVGLLRENTAVHIDALSGNGAVFWR